MTANTYFTSGFFFLACNFWANLALLAAMVSLSKSPFSGELGEDGGDGVVANLSKKEII